MILSYIRLILAPVIILLSSLANATPPAWQIVPNDSTITFTATQNNSPVSGQFKSFSAEINFDPAELDKSNVYIIVDIGSVTTSYKEIGDTLKTSDWFDVKLFPQAIFKAVKFTKTENNSYQANGTLTIRDKTLPVTLSFVLDEYTQNKAHVKGSTSLKRSAFSIGKGDWAKTDNVKDDVKVDFTLSVIRK